MGLQLQGMDDQTYFKILEQINDIRYLIVKAGGMATKTRVEEVLMARYGCDRSDAHSLVNCAEAANVRDFMTGSRGATWREKRPEPRIEDWPELEGSQLVSRFGASCQVSVRTGDLESVIIKTVRN